MVEKKMSYTLDRFFEEWEEGRKGTISPSTERSVWEKYKNISSFYVESYNSPLGRLKLTEIGKDMVISLRAGLSDRMMSYTANATISLLKTLLSEAVNDRLIEWNPCNGVKTLKRTEPPARDTCHRALTKEETTAFFLCARNSWYYELYRFLINSGLRCGEAGALRFSDIKGDVLEIRRTVIRTKHGTQIGSDVKTGSGRRDIPLTAGLKEILETQERINTEVFGKRTGSEDPDRRWFYSARGGILSPGGVDINIKKICSTAGIEPFTAHAFRDTFATRAIESGMNPKTLQEILGHSSYEITMSLYAHVMPSTKAEEMRRVKTFA